MPTELSGRVVAITGAARGIGLATAKECKAAGMKVAIGDLDGNLAERAAAENNLDLGRRIDVTDRDEFAAFLDAVENELGPLYALVNNAGIFRGGRFADEPDEATERIIDANIRGVATGTKLALQRLVPRRAGHIVNIASIGAVVPSGGAVTYSMSKSAVLSMTRALRGELHDTGVRTTVIMPGVIETEMTAPFARPKGLAPPAVQPAVVGQAIVKALRTGKTEMFVPGALTPVGRLIEMLGPRAGDALKRATGLSKMVMDQDAAKAARYEERVSSEYGRSSDGD